MVKKKGGRDMNPADAFRKVQRAKEIARNKKERKFQRDAHAMKANPNAIKEELKEVLDLEQEGRNNLTLRLKKRALQGAYDTAVKRKKEEELRAKTIDVTPAFTNQHGHGVLERRPEDSVYYHPTLNPEGLPPPGKPQRYRTESAARAAPAAAGLPVPAPPPMPAGPAPPQLLPPPDSAAQGSGAPLPPPPGPPPGVLPPPLGPPPGMAPAKLAPPPGPPPNLAAAAPPLAPPVGPPPGFADTGGATEPSTAGASLPIMPPPALPPPGFGPPLMPPHGMQPVMPPPAGPPPGFAMAAAAAAPKKAPTITGASTVVRMPRAQDDRRVTAMVPASVRVRRDAPTASRPRVGAGGAAGVPRPPVIGPGFGLAPAPQPRAVMLAAGASSGAAAQAPRGAADADRKYADFLAEMASLGALAA